MNYHYFWWPLAAIVYYYLYSWMSYKNNVDGGSWFWIMFIFGSLCPLWLIVSRISKNILFDGILYDNIMFLTYVGTMLYLGQGDGFGSCKWLGLTFVVIGSIMLKV